MFKFLSETKTHPGIQLQSSNVIGMLNGGNIISDK